MGFAIHRFKRLPSTMEKAHALARKGAGEGTWIVAETQTQGRGRLGRKWNSPLGGLYCSLILRPTRPQAEIPQLALVAGLAAAEAIHDLTRLYPSIRWPNDLLINGKKVAGILVEAKDKAVVAGIGINVTTDVKKLPPEATSLAACGAKKTSPDKLLAALRKHLGHWYAVWAEEGFAPIRQALRSRIGHFGEPVTITTGRQHLEGAAQDLDEQGRLVVRLDSGIQRSFEAGEVTLLR